MAAPRRLYLPPDAWPPADAAAPRAVCDGATAHRIAAVLRLRPGDALRVFDGAGRERAARVETASRAHVELALLDAVVGLPEPPVDVVLACAFPRGNRGDWIVEKATEVGVAQLVPVAAGRAVLDPGAGRLERWRRIAIEAAEQCGRAVLPRIGGAPPADALHLVADPGAPLPLRDALARVPQAPGAILLSIGPEGGWSDAERAAFDAHGAVAVSLGPRILRVETAAIVGAAQIIEATASPSWTVRS